jgi:hypothetical protein
LAGIPKSLKQYRRVRYRRYSKKMNRIWRQEISYKLNHWCDLNARAWRENRYRCLIEVEHLITASVAPFDRMLRRRANDRSRVPYSENNVNHKSGQDLFQSLVSQAIKDTV